MSRRNSSSVPVLTCFQVASAALVNPELLLGEMFPTGTSVLWRLVDHLEGAGLVVFSRGLF